MMNDYQDYSHTHKSVWGTPFEDCDRALRALRHEQLKSEPNTDQLTKLRYQIAQFPAELVSEVFGTIVDIDGW